MPDPPEALTRAAAAGDAEAMNALLAAYLPDLRAFVRLRTGPMLRARESSSDIVQSVCREVLEHADRFRFPGESAFRHWLFTTALRKLSNRRDYYQAGKRDAHREVPLDAGRPTEDDRHLLDVYESFSTPSARAMVREEVARVEAAFDHLTDEQREVVSLAHVVGLSRAEIAERTGRSEGAVRTMLHRALVRLSGLLGEADA